MPDVTMEACMKAVCGTTDACILAWLDPWSRFHESNLLQGGDTFVVGSDCTCSIFMWCRQLPYTFFRFSPHDP